MQLSLYVKKNNFFLNKIIKKQIKTGTASGPGQVVCINFDTRVCFLI